MLSQPGIPIASRARRGSTRRCGFASAAVVTICAVAAAQDGQSIHGREAHTLALRRLSAQLATSTPFARASGSNAGGSLSSSAERALPTPLSCVVDSDGDGVADCHDLCRSDPRKTDPGLCGCGMREDDTDHDGALDCRDECPTDPAKTSIGVCGCGVPELTFYLDADGDGFGDPESALVGCSPVPGAVSLATDCDDSNPRVHPIADEIDGNAVDDDCDAWVDEEPDPRNAIHRENALPGNAASEWEVIGAGHASIQGFATEISVDQGAAIEFKIKTSATSYRIDIYRLGHYGGAGARRVATLQPLVALPQLQPACLTRPAEGLIDCGNWQVSARWIVPPDATSGIYVARPVATDAGAPNRASHIVFIVRDDDGSSDLLFQTSDLTWQAYNSYGGTSLYVDHTFALPALRGFKVSYNRPFATRANTDGFGRRSYLFNAEAPMLRWLEANGFDVSYCSGVDTDRSGSEVREHKVFLSVGHDEYWSAGQRTNVEAARDAGVHLAFFSGNECFWKTRWEDSIAAGGGSQRTLVCYKETKANAKIDPLPNVWTGTWRDMRFSPPADGGRPENALTGTLFRVNGPDNASITVPAADGRLRFWRNTSVATLAPGQSAVLAHGVLGHEWDEVSDNGLLPAGLFRLSSTTRYVSGLCLLDYGSSYGAGSATHSLTLHRAESGALVFSAGSIQWSWGLDAHHDESPTATDARVEQATVNLLADMHVLPETLRSGLVPAAPSTDATPPASAITWPITGTCVPCCVPIVITGTAVDSGGGVVAGVEVSLDQGASWHPASGRESWSFHWPCGPNGDFEIWSRAVDDSGNLETMRHPAAVTRQFESSCPVSMWNAMVTPASASGTGPAGVQIGVRFRSDVDGVVTGLRFYKTVGNNGLHVGRLWTASGSLLGTMEFTNESARGWQQSSFATPIPITAGAYYVASYYTQGGGFAFDLNYFKYGGFDNPPLHAPQSGVQGANGVYRYGSQGFPDASYLDTNYWVDVVFEH